MRGQSPDAPPVTNATLLESSEVISAPRCEQFTKSKLVLQWDNHHDARLVADCPRRVTLSGQILRKDSFAGSEPMGRAVAEPDFHAAGQCNYVLAAGRVMPIDERSRCHPGEYYAGRWLQRRLFGQLTRRERHF